MGACVQPKGLNISYLWWFALFCFLSMLMWCMLNYVLLHSHRMNLYCRCWLWMVISQPPLSWTPLHPGTSTATSTETGNVDRTATRIETVQQPLYKPSVECTALYINRNRLPEQYSMYKTGSVEREVNRNMSCQYRNMRWINIGNVVSTETWIKTSTVFCHIFYNIFYTPFSVPSLEKSCIIHQTVLTPLSLR